MKINFTILILFFAFQASAQKCGTVDYLRKSSSRFLSPVTTPATTSGLRDTLPNEIIVVPVVVHVLYNNEAQNISNDQILSQIAALNADYRRLNEDRVNTPAPFAKIAADTKIKFCLSKTDPDGRYTSGIVRKFTQEQFWLSDDQMKFSSKGGDDAWDSKRYLNIWVCNLFNRTLGYSVMPGGPTEKDGVVIHYNVFGTTGNLNPEFSKGRTATHEIGHWLGLKHLWGDASCGDDGIADTPPQQSNNSYCPSFPRTSSCSINPFGDMFMDYMDFTDDECMNMFTAGQRNEMRGQFAMGHARNSILNSAACDSALREAGPVPGDPVAHELKVSVFPNPFTSQLTINSTNAGDIIGRKIKLYDVTGKVYIEQILQSQTTVIPVYQIPAGVYFLKIYGQKKPSVYKLIKQSFR
ncbi:MAG: M43 family zinc metalloprotease [Bacteroidota bacterium]|nr:M43 family zinc metalloprotease [Bacteroidota bacterium]